MTLSYVDAVLIDLATLAVVLPLLARHGRLGHSHPATIYVFFHVYAFSLRLIALAQGAVPLFAEPFWGPNIEPLHEEEIVRAAVLADLVLVAMTLAWLWTAQRKPAAMRPSPSWHGAPLRPTIVYAVAAISVPIGVIALLAFSRLPGVDNTSNVAALGQWSTSSYILILQSWAGLGLISLIYLLGFRTWLLVPVLLYLGVMGIQGFHRFRAIIPSILLVQIYLDRRGLRWPNGRIAAVFVAIALIFFPLKGIGRALQQGAPPAELVSLAVESTIEVLSGNAPDQTFLDQLASGMSLVDEAQELALGVPYIAVLTLPVPRQWWPEKPTLSAYMGRISRPSRPMLENGMILTFIGDLYANFSYFGLFLVAPLLAFVLGRFYFSVQRDGVLTVGHFAYSLLACNLIQIYRDGLVSIVMFTVVNMLPLTLIVVLHLMWARLRIVRRRIASS